MSLRQLLLYGLFTLVVSGYLIITAAGFLALLAWIALGGELPTCMP